MDIRQFWNSVLKQSADEIRKYFEDDAYINWHNTNEHFNVDEFIRANCEYPGTWSGEVERVIYHDDMIITATHVYSDEKSLSFHVTSFIKLNNDRISAIDEYWGDDSDAPEWRRDMKIGKKIKE